MIKPKVIDLFAGVGGMSLGFEQEGFDVVLANEYDESIANAYRVNHKNTKMVVGDITQLDLEKTFGDFQGKIDVIIMKMEVLLFLKFYNHIWVEKKN